jgi:hypothetical protein
MYRVLLSILLVGATSIFASAAPVSVFGESPDFTVKAGEVVMLPVQLSDDDAAFIQTSPKRKTYMMRLKNAKGELENFLVFGTGVGVPKIDVDIYVIRIDFEKRTKDTIQDSITVVVEGVAPAPPQPPGPGPGPGPEPNVPAGTLGLVKTSYDAAKLVPNDVLKRTAQKYAAAMHSTSAGIDAAIAAGTNPPLSQFASGLKSDSDAALGSDVNAWTPWRSAMDPRMKTIMQQSQTLQTYSQALKELEQGLLYTIQRL